MSRASNPGQAPKAAQQPGRETVLTMGRIQALANLISAGNYVKVACKFVGVGETSFHKWRNRGEQELDRVDSEPGLDLDSILESFEGKDPATRDAEGEPLSKGSVQWMWLNRPEEFGEYEWAYVVFTLQVEKARAAAEVRILHTIHTAAGRGNWQAGAWWLERTFPDRYGRTDRIQMSGTPGGEPIRTDTVVTVDQVNEALAKLMKPNGPD